MALMIHEILEKVAEAPTRKEKSDLLIKHNTLALRDILKGAFDDNIVFLLPTGAPPYQADDAPHGYTRTSLYNQTKKFRYFVKGGPGEQIASPRRERMFVEILEGVHPKEAELCILMKDKKLNGVYKGVTKKLVQDTWPKLIRS